MLAKELMIGDWVRISNVETNISSWRGRNVRVECLPDDTMIRTYFTKKYYNNYSVDKEDEIEPIPLTDEILEKNGFEYFHKHYASLSYEHPFVLTMKQWPDENGLGGLWTISDIVEIRFVHELQHALRLCGLDELANNFKV